MNYKIKSAKESQSAKWVNIDWSCAKTEHIKFKMITESKQYITSQCVQDVLGCKPIQSLKVWKQVFYWRVCMLLNAIYPAI